MTYERETSVGHRSFFQSHSQNGYSAKVTIEWSAPDDVDLLPNRAGDAESIAAEALDLTFKKPMEIAARASTEMASKLATRVRSTEAASQ